MSNEPRQRLIELLEAVKDETSFLVFVQALAADRVDEVEKEKTKPSSPYGPGANGWENCTIEDFLLAAIAWAKATELGENSTRERSEPNHWSRFAHFLHAGKIYE